jgi:hypothetical protein
MKKTTKTKSKSSKKKFVNIQEERPVPANMDSLIQQVKAQPIVKETDVGNNKKTKIAKPSKFEAMFKEMKVSEEYTKKTKYKFDHFKDNTSPQKG